jgi:tricorn protease
MLRITVPAIRLRAVPAFAALLTSLLLAGPAAAVDTDDTRLLSDPAVSAEHVAFTYAGDLWVADREGGRARRLTIHPGAEANPRFSPDGRWLAFSGEYDGNRDIYLVPVEGGVPRRLTWHPAEDEVRDFTPDGKAVLFSSPRNVFTGRHQKLYTVSVDGGFPEELPIPHGFKASFSPDGSKIAYIPQREPFNQWKHYRGGTATRIWLYDRGDHSVVEVPQPADRSNDTDPMWMGDKVYFRSDRSEASAGEFNLFSYDPVSGAVEQLTEHRDFPVAGASAGGGVVVYEQAGYLHLYDPAAGASRKLTIGAAGDLLATRPRYVDGSEFLRSGSLSPSGARVAVEARGEIFTVPAEKGDARPITQTPGAHERSPVWSPDGRHLAYVSDASGEYRIHVVPQAGPKGDDDVRSFEIPGAGFYEDLKWSPDSQKISFTDNSWTLYVLDVASGRVTEVDREPVYGPIKTQHHAWSPDSRWLVYTKITPNYLQRVHLYDVAARRSHAVTDGLADVSEPVFDASGRYLYFLSSTDAGPVRTWFSQANNDLRSTRSLYLAVLDKGVESPLAKESDEETFEDEGDEGEPGDEVLAQEGEGQAKGKKGDADPEGEDGAGDETGEVPRVEIAFDGLSQRILALPVPEGMYYSLASGAEGEIYYLEHRDGAGPGDTLHRFTLEDREATEVIGGVQGFVLSGDHKKLLLAQPDDRWSVVDAGPQVEPGTGQLALDRIRIHIDPRREWEQIFNEAWRINRDYFYDPSYHGNDWSAMREKYAAFLPHVTNRDELNRVIRAMLSELSVGHSYLGGGDFLAEPEEVPGGLLGADYAVDGDRYRFAKVFGGLNWNPELRAPLTEPGVDVATGEYLLAVDGRELRYPENLYGRFENTAGKIVRITVGPHKDGRGSRTVEVVPVDDESALRNRDWVEGNLRKVTEATDGRVAYVYVPNTAGLGHAYFKRYFFPQADRQAIIVDERHNGGGQVADYYIDILRRPLVSYWTTRYGQVLETPAGAIQGPKVMLIDETAGSGGDLLPWMFRKFDLGTIIGRRTWGGLVGILGFPTLMDGGFVTAPNLAFWTPEDGYAVENEGVPPDIEVEQWPAEVIAGHDPQLEKAIEVVLQQLEENPPPAVPEPPPFPVKAMR